MGASSSKDNTDTINWNNIKTENISSVKHNFNGLSREAKQLISGLDIPAITESQTSEFTVNHILDKISNNLSPSDQTKFHQLLDQMSSQTQDEDLSATSPFISSEMYSYLVKNSEQQKGGSSKKSKPDSKHESKHKTKHESKHNTKPESNHKHKSKSKPEHKSKKGGSKLDDDSDTSSTSSDSEMDDLIDSTEEEVMKKKANRDKKKHHKEKSDSELSGGELSYLSSSAHTDGDYSDSQSDNKSNHSSSESATTNSVESSSQTETSDKKQHNQSSPNTVTDENNMQSTSISVNTEDINLVSDY
jgi:hypothetical protein